jgi:hypothetical protein
MENEKDFIETRHYLFEWRNSQARDLFLDALKATSKKILTFSGKLGEIYVSITGIFDPLDVLNTPTTECIIFDFRNKGITQIKEFIYRKPSPQRWLIGEWKVFYCAP